jgi:hypothetical protein
MAELVETVESQRQAFHEFPQLLGNLAKGRRDSHIPTAPTTRSYLSEPRQTGGRNGDRGKVEIQNQDSHFPTAPISLRRKEEHHFKKNNKSKKSSTQNA